MFNVEDIVLIIFLAIMFTSAFMIDKGKLFVFLDVIRYFLRVSIFITIFLYLLNLFVYKIEDEIFGNLILANLIQLLYWPIIDKKYDRNKYADFYEDAFKRTGSLKGLILINIPTLIFLLFASIIIFSIIMVLYYSISGIFL